MNTSGCSADISCKFGCVQTRHASLCEKTGKAETALRFQKETGPALTARRSLNPTRILVLGFLIIIAVGSVLLMLPAATASGKGAPPLTALFTATSAACVTGLVVEDTLSYWSTFGHAVILALIQVGGIGFMTMTTLFSILLGRKITMRERMVISKSLNVDDLSGIIRLTRRVLLGTLVFEGAGAAILSVVMARDYGVAGGIWRGVFHAVSAFCNAGFDLLGAEGGKYSLMHYAASPAVLVTVMALIVIGGLGFFVWGDIIAAPRRRRLQLHTKLVLATSAVLTFAGAALFLAEEWANPATMGAFPVWQKVLGALFQSVTTRTAGFDALGQAGLTGPSQAVTMLLMFVGGSPGSTAGGLKTTTLAVLLLCALAVVRGRREVSVFRERVSRTLVINAVALLILMAATVFFGSFIIAAGEDVAYSAALYETISAIATVGLSEGITPSLGALSRLTLIVLMFFGRVGIVTFGYAALARGENEPNIRYPEGRIMIG